VTNYYISDIVFYAPYGLLAVFLACGLARRKAACRLAARFLSGANGGDVSIRSGLTVRADRLAPQRYHPFRERTDQL
jgi:hypothetical protein